VAVAPPSRRHRPSLRGEIDIDNASSIGRELLGHALDSLSRTVVIDCSELEFIDSSGIDMLVQLGRLSERRIELVNVPPGPLRTFEVCGLGEMFGLGAPDRVD
jgi:anti-anti-sigma factor